MEVVHSDKSLPNFAVQVIGNYNHARFKFYMGIASVHIFLQKTLPKAPFAKRPV